jgi:hypothetical protein
MNYEKHYNLLIERARVRQFDGYTEKHHVVPKCMGGTDDASNLVSLTPEEHYVAHQLLVKMHPDVRGLVSAVQLMTVHHTESRTNNKLFGWIRRRLAIVHSIRQAGENNSQYGSYWVHNKSLRQSKRVAKDYCLEDGWEIGRVINFDKPVFRTREEWTADRVEDAKKLAYELYDKFMNSEFESVTSFAKSINTSQPRLTMMWKKYVTEYNEVKKHGKSFKK